MENPWWKNLKLIGIVVAQAIFILSVFLEAFGVPAETAALVLKVIGALDVIVTAVLSAAWGVEVGFMRGRLVGRTQRIHQDPNL